MDYENKYLKYKNKYLKLREELISQGINVDEMLDEALGKWGDLKKGMQAAKQGMQNAKANAPKKTSGFTNILKQAKDVAEKNIDKAINKGKDMKREFKAGQNLKKGCEDPGLTGREEDRKTLLNKGVDKDMIDEIMAKTDKTSRFNKYCQLVGNQSGGNIDSDIFIPNNDLSEINLTETPNVFDQVGGDRDLFGIDRPLTREESIASDAADAVGAGPIGKAVAIKSAPPPVPIPAAAPAPNPQKSTTTTNVRNVYNYFDPLYPAYTVPAYNTVVTTTPLYTVPVNTFPILKRNDNFFLDDDEPPRRTSRRKTSRRKSSRRSSKRSSKRKTPKRRSRK